MVQKSTHVQKCRVAAIALGGNSPSPAGSPAETLRAALMRMPGRLLAVSRFWRTPAYPPGSGPDFVNAAALIRADLSADALLLALHDIEAAFGRERQTRWGPRSLDLDLLMMGDMVLPDPKTVRDWIDLPEAQQRITAPDQLILPHPRMQDRGFVLIPLAEIAPNLRHPLTGRTVSDMVHALSDAEKGAILPIQRQDRLSRGIGTPK
ncbi:2-amino-4-hydroxy-6-hydroxymethyldihydropteridine diphosphokinase [Albidovulum inexpectatum]|uniref:2-amino-4-hydroxy-6-hydroxymethyldihydropteridine pyrophosphokinase n=1 Tax=Albidovulum inexpectatum TaxID=196587 RepID=A0A2S5JDT2_9RHOB|nr:2-amino-4-hydroxy-6-hydroxymethyldihydropteridine diphosphokinase [Albidovulum inexpectatum]PPB79570.1 2-amino-4-hydroxy-6-hydroxymethyldihydropteridine diphosphokinase [Albidovulum inexpectatum]